MYLYPASSNFNILLYLLLIKGYYNWLNPLNPLQYHFPPLYHQKKKKKKSHLQNLAFIFPLKIFPYSIAFHGATNNVNYGFVYLIPYKNRIMLCKPLGWPLLLSAVSMRSICTCGLPSRTPWTMPLSSNDLYVLPRCSPLFLCTSPRIHTLEHL